MSIFFFFKQKTAYEMRISDWSSDVCSSDLPAADVIDVPFALKPDRMAVYSPIDKCRNAIGLAIAMETYASNFFQGGGVPPLAVTGPLPKGPEAPKPAVGGLRREHDAAPARSKHDYTMAPDQKRKGVRRGTGGSGR